MQSGSRRWVLAGAVLAAGLITLIPAPACRAADNVVPQLELDTGATAWMLTSTALVLLMVPGLGMFYGGLVRTKNVLGTMMHSFAAMAIIGVLWAVCGYAFAFGPSALGGWIGWNPHLFMLRGAEDAKFAIGGGKAIPELVFAMFQGKFAIITPALIAGAFAERVRFRGYCVFIAVWALLVYNPLCHWVWASDGFLNKMGALDYAGGTVVHISSGVSGLIAVLYLGARKGYPATSMRPNNLVMTMMGAGLLWVGWFGFNAGSSCNSNMDTARALTVTQVAAAAGALAWLVIEGLHHQKPTSLGFCSGILAGLVVITPAAGVVGVGGAIALACIASCVSYCAILAKSKLGYDDSLDVFGVHGIAGTLGAVCLALFIRPAQQELFLQANPHWTVGHQLAIQATAVAIAIAYAASVSAVLVLVVDKVVGLRMDPKREAAGMDHCLHGEQGYGLVSVQ
jgi:Amt family ammonium transporter